MKNDTQSTTKTRDAAVYLREHPGCECCLVDGEHSEAVAVLDPDDPLGMRSACPVHVGVPRDVLDELRSANGRTDTPRAANAGRPIWPTGEQNSAS